MSNTLKVLQYVPGEFLTVENDLTKSIFTSIGVPDFLDNRRLFGAITNVDLH